MEGLEIKKCSIRVMVFLWWSCWVHESHVRTIRVMQDPWGPWRVHEVQGGFNEVLVGTLEGLEIKEGYIRVIMFPWRSGRVHVGPVRFMRVIEGPWASKRINQCLIRFMDCIEVKEVSMIVMVFRSRKGRVKDHGGSMNVIEGPWVL